MSGPAGLKPASGNTRRSLTGDRDTAFGLNVDSRSSPQRGIVCPMPKTKTVRLIPRFGGHSSDLPDPPRSRTSLTPSADLVTEQRSQAIARRAKAALAVADANIRRRRMRHATLALLTILLLPACADAEGQAATCGADPEHWARTAQGCLAIQAYGPAQAEVLVGVLHGDVSTGGPARYHRPVARRISETLPGVAAVALVRPGYPDGEGRISDASAYGRSDHYTPENLSLIHI